jgi:hypothetical protein
MALPQQQTVHFSVLEKWYRSRGEEDNATLLKSIYAVMKDAGQDSPFLAVPTINGRPLDLVRLYRAVIKRGGFQKVSNSNKWNDVISELGLPSTQSVFSIRMNYSYFLFTYEQKALFDKTPPKRPKAQVQVQQVASLAHSLAVRYLSTPNIVRGFCSDFPGRRSTRWTGSTAATSTAAATAAATTTSAFAPRNPSTSTPEDHS